MGTKAEIYDVVGVGFGPSNLALAVALEEHESTRNGNPLKAAFFEKQPELGWHRNMLLPSAKMQISFLKDLATFRNPASRFSFVSYLHAAGRLAQFVNNQDFFPTRQEFHDYLEWAESHFSDRVSYSSEVLSVKLPSGPGRSPAGHVEVEVRDQRLGGRTRLVKARNLVVSTGLVPRMPTGVERDKRVWHSSEFLAKFRALDPAQVKRVAVVGAGQSAAEIVRFFYDELPGATVSAVMPSYGYSIADDTPFANRIFDADAVDDYYGGTQRAKDSFWRYHRNTNYGVVDDEVIRDLHQRAYDDEVRGTPRLDFRNLSRVDSVKQTGDDVRITMHSVRDDSTHQLDVDVLVFATGYDSMEPSGLLGDLEPHCLRDEQGRLRVQRDYRLLTGTEVNCGVYLQGGTEHTHGLASSLLSNIAVRSGEIADSIAERRSSRQYDAA
ncbi:lysine N(6)-hydroxylase/L-ornithine N(5)-oxygenase family protein [Streptomyces griseomycini]|uniref:L-lysine N6-monooxygenase MbtG n=1 Tax=Streptomyces griseomycini TaxID=66895 RepID=A0A7W7VAH8_9ACTN|nr:SidA/IucD/PvdA family monooxygenase [Streptomyces griseomycini]MBB4902970.1 L-ornithine N5-oxygenase [Streptomyces griseomycini]GGQ36466.1 lysine/ornithine N-monooxygenase [Streptomyces griseomycini]GGR51106.1 lysine/ornithine N-monooxygenase [Streptomyces griseomycini]